MMDLFAASVVGACNLIPRHFDRCENGETKKEEQKIIV